MLVPIEKIDLAKQKYDGQAIEEIVEYFGLNYNEKTKAASCPFHEDNTPSFIWNEKSNSFHCFSCNVNFGIIDLYMEQGLSYLEAVQKLFEKTGIEYNFGEKGLASKSSYVYPKREEEHDMTQVIEYLSKRKISERTIKYTDIQSDIHGNIVYNYYNDSDVLMNVKYRPSHKIKKGEPKCWFQKGTGFTPVLFNMNKCDPSKPLVVTEGECFKGDAEILTPDGWVRLDNYNGQQVMQVDNNMEGSFVIPIAYVNKEYDGDMLRVRKGGNYTFDATENHNMVYIKSNGEVVKKKADDMPKNIGNAYIPTVVTCNGQGIPLTNDQIALYLAVSADCTIDVRKTTRHSRFGVKKDRKFIRLKGILDRLGIECFENTDCKDGYKYLGFTTPDWIKSKTLPQSWIYEATLEQRKFILEEMVYWGGNKVNNRNQVEYSSKIYDNAVLMQTLAHTSGCMSTIMKRKNKFGEWYKVSILLGKNSVSFQTGFDERYHYKGKVYCVKVPTGMILVRQEGHISVVGNCDCLSLIEAGYTNVVSVPNGSQNMQWIEENWDWLEQFPKIIIWSDNDEPGIKMRKEAIHRLGSWRTYYIEITDHVPDEYTEKHPELKGKLIKDANELLFYYGKDKVLSYLNNPLELPIENVTDLSTAEDFDIDSAEGLYTGIKDLDNQIYKLVFGTVNIITGKSGEGKSIFVNQIAICQALQQGYDVFVFSGELPTPHLKNWVETNMIGRENIEMRNGHVRVFDTEAKKKMREWYSGRVMVYDDSYDTTAKSLLIKMEEMARKFGTKVFLIDNLMMVDLECSEEGRLQAEKDFVKSLIFFAKKFNVLVFLVAHPRKIGGEIRVTKEDIAGSSNIVNLAHMVFSVHRYTEKEKEGEVNNKGDYLKGHEPKEYDSVVEVLKNRITGLLPECELYFDYNSYRFYRTPEELWMRYKWNTDTTPLNKTDPNKEKRKGLSPL